MSDAEPEESILLVEDDEGVRCLVMAMLEHHGYTALEAASPSEALDLFKQHGSQIKLVITDVIMPKMTGIELAKEIFKLSPDTKVIFMSGYMAGDLPARIPGRPDPVILQKPFSSETLIQSIRGALA